MTYWERNGRYGRENEILRNKYIPDSGLKLTNNKSANEALIHYQEYIYS